MKSFGFNAYLIDLPSHLYISLIFNVEDLTFYRCGFAPLTFSASATGGSATSSPSIPKLNPARPSVVNDDEAIPEDEIVNTGIGCFQRLLVHWKVIADPMILVLIQITTN